MDSERAREFYINQQFEQAVQASRAALQQCPDCAFAQGILAQALLKLGQHKEALAAFDNYFAQGGAVAQDALWGRGLARMRLGDYGGAAEDFTHALDAQIKPDAELIQQRGWAYFFADAWQLAWRDFDRAILLNPDNGDAYIGRGLASVMVGHYLAAVADADKALSHQPRTPEMMHNLACIFAQASARVEADSKVADHAALARHYREQAVQTVRRALDLVPASQKEVFWREKVLPDPALAPIRNLQRFKGLEPRPVAPAQ